MSREVLSDGDRGVSMLSRQKSASRLAPSSKAGGRGRAEKKNRRRCQTVQLKTTTMRPGKKEVVGGKRRRALAMLEGMVKPVAVEMMRRARHTTRHWPPNKWRMESAPVWQKKQG